MPESFFRPTYRRLRPDDTTDAWALSAEAGWNQTAADWRFLLTHGRGVGVFDGSRLVATTVVLPLGRRVAWIGMVVVTASHRRRGLATRLLDDALAWADTRRLTPALDATPAGRAVYGRRGFTDGITLGRWIGVPVRAAHPPGLRLITRADLPRLAAQDARRFGLDRSAVLAYLLDVAPGRALVSETADGAIRGYLLGRPGRTAAQLGPLVADDADTAHALLHAGLAAVDGPALLDVPDGRAEVLETLGALGFTRQRGFMRMTRGPLPAGRPNTTYAIAGPELG